MPSITFITSMPMESGGNRSKNIFKLCRRLVLWPKKTFHSTSASVGNDRNTAAVREFLNDHSIGWREVAASQKGWEQVTLNALSRQSHTLEGFVFYAHTKGAFTPSRFNADWRHRMTFYTVTRWREALLSLETHHAYGCHWMQLEGFWLFGGNFWWTRMSHLRLLPPPGTHSRWAAEGWVGLLPRYIAGFTACDPAGPFPGEIGASKARRKREPAFR